jgi:hypothetical protein
MCRCTPLVQGMNPYDCVSVPGCVTVDQLRMRWLELMRVELPAAAERRPDWPIRLDHCFGRVVLDEVCGRPWREAVRAPAWRNLDEAQLRRAIALAEGVLAGSVDLAALNARSLQRRGKLTHEIPSPPRLSRGPIVER